MNCRRTIYLAAPISAEDLWQRLATILPKLLKVQVRITHRHSSNVVVGPDLPPLQGPTDYDGRRSYTCSELRVSATINLNTAIKAGHAYRYVDATIISSTMSTGRFVLELNSGSVSPDTAEPIDRVYLRCSDIALDEHVALIRAAVDVKEVALR